MWSFSEPDAAEPLSSSLSSGLYLSLLQVSPSFPPSLYCFCFKSLQLMYFFYLHINALLQNLITARSSCSADESNALVPIISASVHRCVFSMALLCFCSFFPAECLASVTGESNICSITPAAAPRTSFNNGFTLTLKAGG